MKNNLYFFAFIITFMMSGCAIKTDHSIKTTQFRYSNSVTKNLYLPINSKVCVLDKNNYFPESKITLENFIKNNWKDKAKLKESCVGADFYIRFSILTDLYDDRKLYDRKSYFSAVKLDIYHRTERKIIADFTVINSNRHPFLSTDDKLIDNIIKIVAPVYLNNKNIFGE